MIFLRLNHRSTWTVAVLACALATRSRAADPPRFVGRAGCATATCHGGLSGSGPAWHSSASVFESRDPHAWAGSVLLSDLSRRIVAALEPDAARSGKAFVQVLQTRCVSCHAPEALPATAEREAVNEEELPRTALAAGVSCEACHGPASNWQGEHTRRDWDRADRFSAATGMLDTESLIARTDNCSRCHVGSRTADGRVRDMNHDMIAAGHPQLTFDMVRYQNRLPAHWTTNSQHSDGSAAQSASNIHEPSTRQSVHTRVLLAAIRLSQERRADSRQAPQPELSEYDCKACHHALELGDLQRNDGFTGTARWQPWYTIDSQLAPTPARAQLWLGQPEFGQLLRRMEESIDVQEPARSIAPDETRGQR